MATYGIHGAVDRYADLPDAARLDLNTTFIVRLDENAPNGAGLYWVRLSGSVRVWEFLDALSLQRADEVPYDNRSSGLQASNVQTALDLLSAGMADGSGIPGGLSVSTIPGLSEALSGINSRLDAMQEQLNQLTTGGTAGAVAITDVNGLRSELDALQEQIGNLSAIAVLYPSENEL